MRKDFLDLWIEVNVLQICKENNLDIKDWQRNKFFIFDELWKRFEIQQEENIKNFNPEDWCDIKGEINNE